MIMYVIFLAIFRGPPLYPRCQSSSDASRMSVHSKLAGKKKIDLILKIYSKQMVLTANNPPSLSLGASATCPRLIVPTLRKSSNPGESSGKLLVTRGSGSLPGPGVHHLIIIGDANGVTPLGVETDVTHDTSPSVTEILLLYDDFIVYLQPALSLRLSYHRIEVVIHQCLRECHVRCPQLLTRQVLLSATWLTHTSRCRCLMPRPASPARPVVVYVYIDEVKHVRDEQINAHDFIIVLTSEWDDCLIATDLHDHKITAIPMYDCPALHRPVVEINMKSWLLLGYIYST